MGLSQGLATAYLQEGRLRGGFAADDDGRGLRWWGAEVVLRFLIWAGLNGDAIAILQLIRGAQI